MPRASIVIVTVAVALVHCSSSAQTDASADAGDATSTAPHDLDLLVVMSDGSEMSVTQSLFLAQLASMYQQLMASPLRSLQVGVISSDLGTSGSDVPGCAANGLGDDGLLNPIRNGAALAAHEPWLGPPPPSLGRPADCTDPNEYPPFLSFDSTSDAAVAVHDLACNLALWVGGCGIRQPLEAIQRALVEHDATDRAGNTSPNAGFVRENAVLAILVVEWRDDESVRDCSHSNGSPCEDATDVFNWASTMWADTNLTMRFLLAQPGSALDPTWPLDRYVSSANPTAGWLALKPGHPERIVFGAIAGVPLPNDGPGTAWRNADGSTNWDMLLGAAGGGGPDDFVFRDSTQAIRSMTNEGPVSMQVANRDTNCPLRVVPACYREGSTYSSTYCLPDQQYWAGPARRIIEVARRFDQSALCHSAPCRNGFVASICASEFAAAVHDFTALIVRRIGTN